MLRRKLLAILGSLVLLLLAVAVTAVFLLQGLLADLRHVRSEALSAVDEVSRLSGQVAIVQIQLYRLQLGDERHLDELLAAVESSEQVVANLGTRYMVQEGKCAGYFADLKKRLPEFSREVASLATAQDPGLARAYNEASLSTAVAMNQDILRISEEVRGHAEIEQAELVDRFRWIVLGLSLAFLLLINTSILLLIRAAGMVLRPVDRLVEASRALGEEDFSTRVPLDRNDEFGELAKAYNSLAEHLQASEQRKLETLQHAALTLNHELNNAMAIIELQLELLKRTARGDASQERYLRQIRESLERMDQTVDSLKRVRRIVLTDYVQGMKMLDLQRSTEESP